MILQQNPAAPNGQPISAQPASTKPDPRASTQTRASGNASAETQKTASAEQPIIDRLIPAWQPARGVSQTAITLAAVLVLMLLVGGITSLGRRGAFFLKRREWKQRPPPIRAWKLGPEGASFELDRAGRLEDEHIRVLTERVDTIVSSVHVMNTTLSRLTLEGAESESGPAPQQPRSENANA